MTQSGQATLPFRFSRGQRYQVIARCLPDVYRFGIRRSLRASQPARASTAGLACGEFHRRVHDVYCGMFIRGYRQATGYRVDPLTGLAVVLFAILMYVFDDELENQIRCGGDASAAAILQSRQVAEVWAALAAYLHASGRTSEVLDHIARELSAPAFDDYRLNLASAWEDGDLGAVQRLVEFDSGAVLVNVYEVIRLFNGHHPHAACSAEFWNLGMAGKFLDDLSDYTADVRSGVPNLLDALAREAPSELAAARAALAADDPVTLDWWRAHGPVTLARYLEITFGYYRQVHARALRLPLDAFLMLLGTRKFWAVSTIRPPGRRAS